MQPSATQSAKNKDDQPQPVNEDLAARKAACGIIEIILGNRQTLSDALDRDAAFNALDMRDKAFARMLIATTLRRMGQIDDLIARTEEKPGHRTTALTNILRIGIAQILFMNVPDHAAVDTSVRLTEAAGMNRQKGFVNGVLRNIARTGKEWISNQDEARLNTPEWLLKTWIEDFGLKTAAQIAKANLAEASLDITVKDPESKNHWAATFKATNIAGGTLRIASAGGPVAELPGYNEGAWWVQDAAAAIPAKLLGDVAGQTVVDLCAAPGGKTAQLAAMGAHVIAIDRSAQRLNRLKDNMKRLGLESNVVAVAADAAEWNPPEAPRFILLDAPCTATGTIRRNPDIPRQKLPRDMQSLVILQREIMDHAFEILAPGGVMIYCVCSLQKAEGEHQIRDFLDRFPNASKIPVTAKEIGGMEEPVTEEGDVRIFPYYMAASGGMDGFFISRIRKRNV
jgi:16S rRNA (cytosine967-C5)-methyltransferase